MNETDGGKIHTELSVGEAAKRSGVAVSTLHFYESKGLIRSSRSRGNQRRYAREVLRNFLYGICHCDASWTAGSFIAEATESIRAQVGRDRKSTRLNSSHSLPSRMPSSA